jgi:transcriptional regulator with XRE-family HTH domain
MKNATFGGLIKDFRMRHRLSQLDVSLKIGWSDSTRLSKIEQGRAGKPTRETAEKIIQALGLAPEERGDFLFTGGYLPTDKEIKEALGQIKEKVDTWVYPAYMMDFSWRLLYTNIPNLLAINFGPESKDFVIKSKMNILEYSVLPKDQFPAIIEKGESPNSLKPFPVAQIATFKAENFRFQNEDWYKKLVKKLLQYQAFRDLWPKVSHEDYPKKLQDYEFKRSSFEKNGKKIVLNFHMYTAKITNYPQLQIVLYHPADKFTEDFFKNAKGK